ncbi:MAG: TIGR04563 family protein [Myxococcota bacterium]|nr:TIGR04563 family protein [Myxococcota bacterium]
MTGEKSCRQALYFPHEMLSELQEEARRLDRSLSWLIQRAWKVALPDLKKMPSSTDFFEPASIDGP